MIDHDRLFKELLTTFFWEALMSRMNIAKQDRRRVKYECLRLMSRLNLDPAQMKLISGFIDTYLRLSPEEENLVNYPNPLRLGLGFCTRGRMPQLGLSS